MLKQHLTLLAVIALPLTACSKSEESSQTPTRPSEPTWVLASAPADAMTVSQAKTSSEEGDTIVLRGRIGGRAEPLTHTSPVFTVMDLAIPHCAENEGDTCPTPWDYCCETPSTITANSATIQILNADDHPITETLTALDEVVIVGTVAPRPSDQVLTIRATGVYKEQH